ncbi:hypothetical protein G7046_g8701 [Stylonectria norvegica]|nr:hypothetical protein G7046_g8701 [Stylonectria norvegica]
MLTEASGAIEGKENSSTGTKHDLSLLQDAHPRIALLSSGRRKEEAGRMHGKTRLINASSLLFSFSFSPGSSNGPSEGPSSPRRFAALAPRAGRVPPSSPVPGRDMRPSCPRMEADGVDGLVGLANPQALPNLAAREENRFAPPQQSRLFGSVNTNANANGPGRPRRKKRPLKVQVEVVQVSSWERYLLDFHRKNPIARDALPASACATLLLVIKTPHKSAHCGCTMAFPKSSSLLLRPRGKRQQSFGT